MATEAAMMQVRRATEADLPAIVALMADDALGQQREHYADPLPEVYLRAFAAIDADPHQELVVGQLNDEVVATLQLTIIPYLAYQGSTRAQVESVRVASHLRGQGLGQQLMLWAIKRSRERGAHMLQLTTNASRADAHRFYTRLGFVASHVGMKLRLDQG